MASSFEFGDWIFLLTSIFEMLMFCGFQTGWSSLAYVLVEEGIYSHLCVDQDPAIPSEWNSTNSSSLVQTVRNVTTSNNCVAQQEMLNLAYTLATSVSSLAAFPIGVAMDCVGPRFTRIISGFLLGFSCFIMSYLNKQNPGILFVGLIVASIANIILFITPHTLYIMSFQCMQRFKKGRSMLIGFYCGSWVSSSLAFLAFKVLYENGAVSVAYFFRFLAVACVFLCINAALLYPDSTIPPPLDEKLETKQEIQQKPKNKQSCFRDELKKYKLCLGHMINGRKDNSFNCSPKTEQTCDEWNQLIPNPHHPLDSGIQTDNTAQETSNANTSNVTEQSSSNAIQLTRTKTVLDLSEKPNSSSHILGNCRDMKRVTYAECPAFSSNSCSTDNKHLSLNLTKCDADNAQKTEANCERGTRGVAPKSCQERDEEILLKNEEKPCEIKKDKRTPTLESDLSFHYKNGQHFLCRNHVNMICLAMVGVLKKIKSADHQVWTAISAVSYLKSGISFKNCVKSMPHVLSQVFLTVCKIRTLFFVGTFLNFISDLCGGDRSIVARYVNIFGISHVGAMLMAPLFGYIIDRQCSSDSNCTKPSKDTEKQHQKFMMDIEDTPKVIEFVIQCNRKRVFKINDAVLVTASSTVVFCLLAIIPNLVVQIVTFQLYVFVKVAFDTVFTSVLIIIFPQNHLGKLMGLAALIGALFSLLQYPLFVIMEVWFEGRTIEVNIFLWLLSLLAFGFPIYLWRKASKPEPHSLALVAV